MTDATRILTPEKMAEIAREAMSARTPDPTPEPEEEALPAKIGKYPIRGRLGCGGMSTVYLADHPDLGMPVAIKVLKPERSASPNAAKRLVQEAQLAGKIDHPNIVRIHDAGREGDCPYIVQEHVAGGDLAGYMRRNPDGRLPLNEAVRITMKIARALAAADRQHIVHRDIKPSNILLSSDGEPKLSDLGIAKQFHTVTSEDAPLELTQTHAAIGSPLYMSPEQMTDSLRVDIRADIYSLGVTLYQMVTGELPFSGTSVREMAKKIQLQDLPNAHAANPAVPLSLARVIARMMAKSPSDRYQTPEELVTDLAQLKLYRSRTSAWQKAAAVLLTGLLAALLWLRSQTLGGAGAIGAAEHFLATGQYSRALPLLREQVKQDGEDCWALYGLGLCCLNDGLQDDVDDLILQLGRQPDGEEFAKHLKILSLIRTNDLDGAAELVRQCEGQAKFKLPFLLSKGMILLETSRPEQAQSTLSRALDEASFFPFQRLDVVDALAKLLLRKGQADQAVALYAQNLGGEKPDARPSVLTNYAVALRKTGQPDKADEILQAVMEIHPNDEMAAYLRQSAAEAGTQAQADRMKQLVSLIGDIDAAISDGGAEQDPWRSCPLVLQIMPPEQGIGPHAQLGQEDLWWRQISDALRTEQRFPIVEREELPRLLTEIRLSASDASSEDVKVNIGQLWPASVLLQPTFNFGQSSRTVRVKLVDVATSEIIGVATKTAKTVADQDAAARELGRDIVAKLSEFYPLAGRITSADDGTVTLNIGRIHGVRTGQELGVYRMAKDSSPDALRATAPLGRVRVTGETRFAAVADVVSLDDGVKRKDLRGLIVLEPLDE